MRRITAFPLAAALMVTAAPAHAETGFWHSVGLRGVDSFGVYNAGRTRVRLSVNLRDTEKDGYSAATHFVFTERGRHGGDHIVALHGDGVRNEWHTVTSRNTGHLYVRECLGTWAGKHFTTKRCGGWRRHY